MGGQWVYSLKGNPDSPTSKARFVAKGFSQVKGIDYHEAFSPTARMETLRTLIQVASHHDLDLQQMDVKTAFLHALIEEDIYVNVPKDTSRLLIPNKFGSLKSLFMDSKRVVKIGMPLYKTT